MWGGTREEFNVFLETLNGHDSSITLTSETDDDSIDFLDTTVYKGTKFTQTGQLDVKVFYIKYDSP